MAEAVQAEVKAVVTELVTKHKLFTPESSASGLVAADATAYHPAGVSIVYHEGAKNKEGKFQATNTEILEYECFADASVAFVKIKMREQFTYDGEKHDDLAYLTLGLKKSSDKWEVVHLHRTHGVAATEEGTGKLGDATVFVAAK
eukprot:TRINITY_DN57136_c0_g1_i1.p1 TRINITY_DN57136_c0_g1~~TRINITY_DN57136_c0_g1_i1.p1  ORF type:complete len:167 (+),score=45.96 TRINITY_DN57136_c0_g1_i1:67-501(+)